MKLAFEILHILLCLFLIVVVLLQSGRSYGLSGAIAGGAETFFGKNKGRTWDEKLRRWTSFVALFFIVTSLLLAYGIIK